MIVVNQLTKMRHLIPLENIDIDTVAEAFVKHVFKLHRLPDMIISDHGD